MVLWRLIERRLAKETDLARRDRPDAKLGQCVRPHQDEPGHDRDLSAPAGPQIESRRLRSTRMNNNVTSNIPPSTVGGSHASS